MADTKIFGSFIKTEPITKGWSEDKKYCVTSAEGIKYLLRLSPINQYETKKALFSVMEQIAALGVPMCVPIEFGVCDDGVYTIHSWIDGVDLDSILPLSSETLLSETEQYALGLQAGKIAKKIHAIPIPKQQDPWESKFNREIDVKIQEYQECGLQFSGDVHILSYIEKNRCLLVNRPLCFLVHDYNVLNMMYENGCLKIIDFEYYDIGDPWNEFCCIGWSAYASRHFATGQLRGYFDGEPPMEFFELLALYMSIILLSLMSSFAITTEFGRNVTMKLSQDILKWFDDMQNSIPTWYLGDFYIQWTDGVPYRLKEPFDFTFLKKYGKVFKVFDGQDSGNICFGVADGGKRYFVKFAGAPTDEYTGTIGGAIERLKAAVAPYRDLSHPSLIRFIKAEEIGGGFAIVFDWVDAVCAHRTYPLDHQKFKQIPLESRIVIFEDILDFHRHAAEKGYTAVDFYDGSIMWDNKNKRTVICDIDFYTKGKAYGSQALWGHMIRTASPEERTDGVLIDEISNVYNMGAIAFLLFTNSDCSPEAWPLNMALYEVVKKAVNEERRERQQSIAELVSEWEAAGL